MLKVARPLYCFGNSKKEHIFQLSRELLVEDTNVKDFD